MYDYSNEHFYSVLWDSLRDVDNFNKTEFNIIHTYLFSLNEGMIQTTWTCEIRYRW